MNCYKAHFVSVIDSIYKFIPLLIIPHFLSLTLFFAVLTLSFLNFKRTLLVLEKDEVVLIRGIIRQEKITIKKEKICTISFKKPWYYRPFKMAYLKMDTIAGSPKTEDIKIALNEKSAEEIISLFEKTPATQYSPKLSYIMVLCAVLSNSFAGMAIVSTAISQSGNILGKTIEKELFGTLTTLSQTLSFGIPPAAAVIAYAIVFGYLIAFFINVLRYRHFTLSRNSQTIMVKGGALTHRAYSFKVKQINFLTLRQSIATKLLRFYSVFVNCSGFGKKSQDLSALAPAVKKRDLEKTLKMITPELTPEKVTLKPHFFSILKFVSTPLYPLIAIPLLSYALIKLYPVFSDFIGFVAVTGMIVSGWFLIVRILDFLTSGIGYNDKNITLKYSKGFSLLTVVIPRKKINRVIIRQSIFQRTDNICDVFIYTRAEDKIKHHVKNVNLDKLKGILK